LAKVSRFSDLLQEVASVEVAERTFKTTEAKINEIEMGTRRPKLFQAMTTCSKLQWKLVNLQQTARKLVNLHQTAVEACGLAANCSGACQLEANFCRI
jgi:hypothetical protein